MCDQELLLAEEKWKKIVIPYLEKIYKDQWLPSHDMSHHQRVWINACKLAKLLIDKRLIINDLFAEKLYLASYFHDVGLLIEKGELHGKHSRALCEEFLSTTTRQVNFDPQEMLQAIDEHDDKNYDTNNPVSAMQLKTLLSLADDIDAFGAVGVYRYIEIYLLRKIPVKEIPGNILRNAEKRFDNLMNVVSRFTSTQDIFVFAYERLCYLLNGDSFSESPISLVEWIDENIVQHKKDPFDHFKIALQRPLKNHRVIAFLTAFLEENS